MVRVDILLSKSRDEAEVSEARMKAGARNVFLGCELRASLFQHQRQLAFPSSTRSRYHSAIIPIRCKAQDVYSAQLQLYTACSSHQSSCNPNCKSKFANCPSQQLHQHHPYDHNRGPNHTQNVVPSLCRRDTSPSTSPKNPASLATTR